MYYSSLIWDPWNERCACRTLFCLHSAVFRLRLMWYADVVESSLLSLGRRVTVLGNMETTRQNGPVARDSLTIPDRGNKADVHTSSGSWRPRNPRSCRSCWKLTLAHSGPVAHSGQSRDAGGRQRKETKYAEAWIVYAAHILGSHLT